MRRPPGIYDPAAQLERTALAWNRASVAVLANGALLVRAGLVYDLALLSAAGLAAATVGAALFMLSGTHYSALAGRRVGHLLAGRPRAVIGLAAFVTLLSVIALITTLVR